MFFIEDFSIPKNAPNIKQSGLYNILNALIAKNNQINGEIQSTFIERMLQLTLSDTRLILPFIQLVDTIAKKEKIISYNLKDENFAPVTVHLKNTIERMGSGQNQRQENFFRRL